MTLEKRARGRPRNPDTRASIMTAARRLFLERGSDDVSIDQLCADANVAKTTFYLYFKDKGEIIEAVFLAESERLLAFNWGPDDAEIGLEDRLVQIGISLLSTHTTVEGRGFRQLLTDLNRNHPELVERLYQAGPKRAFDIIAGILDKAGNAGQLKIESVELATDLLIGLWEGFYQFEVEFGAHKAPDPAYIERRAELGVAYFMKLFAA